VLCAIGHPVPAADLLVRLDGTFPRTARADLSIVANETADVVSGMFGRAAPPLERPIICRLGPIPITSLDNWQNPTHILISLTVTDRKYSQFVYQLAHELGHVMLGVHRTNSTSETLAVAVALEALDRLATKWGSKPPFLQWQDYGEKFRQYRQRTEADALRRSGLEPLLRRPGALRSRLRQLNRSIDLSDAELTAERGRDLQEVGAMIIRSEFGVTWSQFVGIERCTVPPPSQDSSFQHSVFDRECIKKQAPTLLSILPVGK
jgi:hypothetical protein